MCKWTQFFGFPFQTSCLLFSSLDSLCVGRHPKDGITTMNRASSSSFLLCLYSRGTIRKGQQTSSVERVWWGLASQGVLVSRLGHSVGVECPLGLQLGWDEVLTQLLAPLPRSCGGDCELGSRRRLSSQVTLQTTAGLATETELQDPLKFWLVAPRPSSSVSVVSLMGSVTTAQSLLLNSHSLLKLYSVHGFIKRFLGSGHTFSFCAGNTELCAFHKFSFCQGT